MAVDRMMNNELMNLKIDPIIVNALNEDITDVDISTKVLANHDAMASVKLLAKQDGVAIRFTCI